MSGSQWGDLGPRVTWGLVMLAAGAVAIWAGGGVFRLSLGALAGVMIWELAMMLGAATMAVRFGIGSGAAVVVASYLPPFLVLPVLGAAVIVMTGQVARDRMGLFAGYGLAIVVAALAMIVLRLGAGIWTALWLVGVVVASDVAGYFAGRLIGGPKFWPSISPKKTWSGTAAGWIGAAIVGVMIGGPALALWSVPVALAGQMGDIAESAIKRHVGVKDSSALIPGHGGVLDRFDAMLGAALLAGLLWITGILPEVG